MEDYCIDLTEEFHCLGGKCKYTCCKGWQIPVDDETFARYLTLKGISGKIKRFFIVKKEPRRIRKVLLRCPFFTLNGLCGHQCKGDDLLMPVVCRNYPRRIMDQGTVREGTLELSCPEAARLFIENPGRREFVACDRQNSIFNIFNEDPVFFRFLREERKKILDYIWCATGTEKLSRIWRTLYPYIYNMHEAISRDKLELAMTYSITEDENAQGKFAIKDRGYAFYPIKTLDRMILECIDYGALAIRVPKFYKFIKHYLKFFSKINLGEVDSYFNKEVEKMMEAVHGLELKYRSYFSYLIQQEWMLAYESYSMIREFTLAVLYTELLMLFDLVEYKKYGALSKEKQVLILHLCEHNVRHNPNLTKNLYTIIREEML